MRKKKSFGQHFLHDKGVVKKIVDAVDMSAEQVVEVGPGDGALTRELVERVPQKKLTLIEADRDLIDGLRELFPGVTLINADAAHADYPEKTDWVLVGNLPYNAAAAILKQVFVREHSPRQAVVMVQREQADRMMAAQGQMSTLSVFIQLYTRPKKLFNVGSGAFDPPPNVESSVIELTKQAVDVEECEAIMRIVRAGFASRRKQLRKNLALAGFGSTATISEILVRIGLTETVRAQELTTKNWRQVYKALE